MPTIKKTIAFIGSQSRIAPKIAKNIVGCTYRLLLCDDASGQMQPLYRTLQQQHDEASVRMMNDRYCSCWEADIIVLAGLLNSEKQVVDCIREVATQKLIISINSCATKDEASAIVQKRAQKLQQLLPYSRIIAVIEPPAEAGLQQQEDIIMAGQDKKAAAVAAELIEAAGLKPVRIDLYQ